MAFVERKIDLTFTLSNGGSPRKITGKRVRCKIANAGPPSQGTADITAYGLPLSMMNELSSVGTEIGSYNKNFIAIEAGDAQSGMALAFRGSIFLAYVDAQAQPEVAFRVQASAAFYRAIAPAEATSIDGVVDVASIMSYLATQNELGFEDGGVNVKLENQYLPGSGLEQIRRLANAAGINWTIENDVLAIWPAGQVRKGKPVVVSAKTGMVGYPAFNQSGVVVRTIFNPALGFGRAILVESELLPACGQWGVYNLAHDLEAQVPNGQWFSIAEASRYTIQLGSSATST